jgi:hypothetical protein
MAEVIDVAACGRILNMRASLAVLPIGLLLVCAIPTSTGTQQPFVHGSDIRFSIETDRNVYHIGESIAIHYTIKNISKGSLYVPRSQWEVKCGNAPHFWSRLEDSSGKHYQPGYAGSCLGADQRSLTERMKKDAVLLKPGDEIRALLISIPKSLLSS